MLFPTPPATADDIRAFCQRFNEGIRVEYKATFDRSVRQSTSKMISALANTLGGVAIIGVHAVNGVPQTPIEGFDETGEELTLVVEQICLQGINPAVIPKITQIQSDVPGKCFLLIEVDESPEAPHAIENQTRVYVRTGNAANPYELAHVDLIIERFTRRTELQKTRRTQIDRQSERCRDLLPPGPLDIEVSVGPVYPRRPLMSRDAVWTFADTENYRGGRFIPGALLRRTNDGVAGLNDGSHEYVDLSHFGFVFWKRSAQANFLRPQEAATAFWRFSDVFQPVLKSLICASRCLLIIWLLQQAPISSVQGCPDRRFPRHFASFSSTLPPRRPARGIWQLVVGQTGSFALDAGTKGPMNW